MELTELKNTMYKLKIEQMVSTNGDNKKREIVY